MKKQIFTIGCTFPGKEENTYDFKSNQSLMDADLVLFQPSIPGYDYENSTYRGKKSYGDSASFEYKEQVKHWRKELKHFIASGKTVFIILCSKKEFYLKTGETSFSGTGKNQSKTSYVELNNNYGFLPIKIGNITPASGSHIELGKNNLFKNFFKYFNKNLQYKVYIDGINDGETIFTGKDKTKALGCIHKIGNGNLVTLPYLDYDEDKFTTKDGKNWTPKGIEFGDILFGQLLKIDKDLNQVSDKTPPPEWILQKKFSTKKEQEIRDKITKKTAEIDKAKQEKEKLTTSLSQEEELKDLLFEKSTPLENAVTKALQTLGYKAGNYDDGVLELDQVINSPEGHRFIGECEGKDNKDINISKFRQLSESLNADFDREEVNEKAYGILFGNPHRLSEPKDRTSDFTDKCKIGAERDKFALIKTCDLYFITKYLKEHKDINFQKACRDAIFNNLGKVVVFPDIPKK